MNMRQYSQTNLQKKNQVVGFPDSCGYVVIQNFTHRKIIKIEARFPLPQFDLILHLKSEGVS